MRLLITGFGPFHSHTENPSQALAESCGARYQVIEVSYQAVDEFVESLDPSGFDALLSLGLSDKARTLLMETVGRNFVGSTPDVRGVVAGPGAIDPTGPPAIAAALWHGVSIEDDLVQPSTNAGSYLCNYLFYSALRRFPEKRIGFLHVPPFAVVPQERQAGLLAGVIAAVRRPALTQ